MQKNQINKYMSLALLEASKAKEEGDLPIACVITKGDQILAKASNKVERTCNPSAHSEILAIELACKKTGSKVLDGCTAFVTLEPCPMCATALVLAKIDTLYFGGYDLKTGACGSKFDLVSGKLNHKIETYGGLMEEESSKILRDFFLEKRKIGKR